MLSNPEKKKLYDQFGHAAFDGSAGGSGHMAMETDLAAVLTVIPDRMEASMNIILKAAIWTIS